MCYLLRRFFPSTLKIQAAMNGFGGGVKMLELSAAGVG